MSAAPADIMFAEGERVVITGLQSAPDLNNTRATVKRYDYPRKRWIVVLDKTNEEKALNAEKLTTELRSDSKESEGVQKKRTFWELLTTPKRDKPEKQEDVEDTPSYQGRLKRMQEATKNEAVEEEMSKQELLSQIEKLKEELGTTK